MQESTLYTSARNSNVSPAENNQEESDPQNEI